MLSNGYNIRLSDIYLPVLITTAHPWEVSCGALRLQYKVIKSPGINTVDSKCLTPVDVAHYAFMSCSTLRLICTLTRLQPLT